MTRLAKRRELGWAAAILLGFAALAFLPLAVHREDVLNFVFLILLSVTLAESWNIVAGYAGQVNLGHAAFFGLGALVARALWILGVPVVLAMGGGAAVAAAFALIIGVAAFRLRGAYFAIGTLALGEILRTTVGNVLSEISTGLAGLAGGLFAYYHISYYPSHPFSPSWTFDALLMTFIGGVGTLHGPVLGAVLYVFLKEHLAVRWVDFHLLIFGVLFITVVLLLPGGLVQAAERARRFLGR
jgi:ABC-type branched-subunit amino acid transport system permease subunit